MYLEIEPKVLRQIKSSQHSSIRDVERRGVGMTDVETIIWERTGEKMRKVERRKCFTASSQIQRLRPN